jgi:hypothetical protein
MNRRTYDADANLQSLCKTCDGRKGCRFDGHFGNPRREYTGPPQARSGRR